LTSPPDKLCLNSRSLRYAIPTTFLTAPKVSVALTDQDPEEILPDIMTDEELDEFINHPSLDLPAHIDFDEWQASGFSTMALLTPDEQRGFQKLRDELEVKAMRDPKSIEAQVFKDLVAVEKLNAANMKAVTAGGWRPASARKA